MKHYVLFLMLSFITTLSFPFQSFAQDYTEDEEGDEIVIINQDLHGNGSGRDYLPVPIQARLFHSACYIIVKFYTNLGEVNVSFTNLTTGSISTTQVNSCIGEVIIPVTLGSGYYRIDFITPEGPSYFGYFTN